MRCSVVTGLAVTLVALAAAGCAGGVGGDPGAQALPMGYSCQSIRAELNKLDGQGARSSVEAVSSGRKVSPTQKAQSDRYNQLLNYYLGARCHA